MNNEPNTRYCNYEKCSKAISRFSRHGSRTANYRYRKQNFCTDACARLHYFAGEQAKTIRASNAQALVDNWIYGRVKGQIS